MSTTRPAACAFVALSMALFHGCLLREDVAPSAGSELALSSPSAPAGSHEEKCRQDPRVKLGLVSQQACVGAELFFRETFSGNGRTCGSCHPAANNTTLDPKFIATLPEDDPLFVAERDADLVEFERPELLRELGVIVVNADGFEDPTRKFVLRSVSHTLSLATSILPAGPVEHGKAADGTSVAPIHRLGWSGDGAPGNGALVDFADGAIEQHATRSLSRTKGADFRRTSLEERQALSVFMLSLGRTRDIDLEQVHLQDAAAERGRRSFLEGPAQDCGGCHRNAGANGLTPDPATGGLALTQNLTLPEGAEKLRPASFDELGIPLDGGFGRTPLDVDGDGYPDAFGTNAFNAPPLIEAADTGPFFHSNAIDRFEMAIGFYTTPLFGDSPAARLKTPSRPEGGAFKLDLDQIRELGRFLRVLNVALNCQQAALRLSAALEIAGSSDGASRAIFTGLLELARAEVVDALEVLDAVDALNPYARIALSRACGSIDAALSGSSASELHTQDALEQIEAADADLGSGMRYELGDGTLLF